MGVDPYLLWVCGINDATENDHRFDIAEFERLENWHGWYGDIPVPPLDDDGFDLVTIKPTNQAQKRPSLDSIFYNGNPSGRYPWTGDNPVTGYIIASCHEDTLLRGLSLVPGFSDLLDRDCIVLPNLNLDEHEFIYRHYCDSWGEKGKPERKAEIDKAIAEGRWIEMFSPWITGNWFRLAIHVLHLVGWTGVTREMLKLMMVWGWA